MSKQAADNIEIARGVILVKVPIPNNPLGYLNCYLVEGKDGWLMVDTGWHAEGALDTLLAGLKKAGLAITDIATIVVTHVHPDHFGLAGKLKQLSPGTRLLTHHWEGALIESRFVKFNNLRQRMATLLREHGVPDHNIPAFESASMPTLEFVTMTMPDDSLFGGEVISTGVFDLEVIWTPGHSPGHICLYEPQNRLFFSGDHILPVITPNVSFHAQAGDNPLGDFVNALRKVQNLPVTRVLPAHEHVFSDLRGRVDELLKHHDMRKEEILGHIRKRPQSAYVIASLLTWAVANQTWDQFSAQLKRSAMMEALAHLEFMRWEGTVKRVREDNLVLYTTA